MAREKNGISDSKPGHKGMNQFFAVALAKRWSLFSHELARQIWAKLGLRVHSMKIDLTVHEF
jgi:hypothetical protein